jgi:hypothetical protein
MGRESVSAKSKLLSTPRELMARKRAGQKALIEDEKWRSLVSPAAKKG